MSWALVLMLFPTPIVLLPGDYMSPEFVKLADALVQGSNSSKLQSLRLIFDDEKLLREVNNKTVSLELVANNLKTSDASLKYFLLIFINRLDWKDDNTALQLKAIAHNISEEKKNRDMAVFCLATCDPPRLKVLTSLFQSGDVFVKRKVAGNLCRVDQTKVSVRELQELYNLVFDGADAEIRYVGLSSLRNLEPGNLKVLDIDKYRSEVHRSCFSAAKMRHFPADVNLLKELVELCMHNDQEVRKTASDGVADARVATKELLVIINQLLLSKDSNVRKNMCMFLSSGELNWAAYVPNLAKCLSDQKPAVRSYAALAVGKLKTKNCVDNLIAIMLGDPNEGVRTMCLEGLNSAGDNSKRVLAAISKASREGLLNKEDARIVLRELKLLPN